MSDTMRGAFERDIVRFDIQMREDGIGYEDPEAEIGFKVYCAGYQAAQADARELVGELVEALKFADDNLYEININNYDHDEVCHLNSRSVEVALSVQKALTKSSQIAALAKGE